MFNSYHQTLFFLHIPKAAGSTLTAIIKQNYDPERVLSIDSKFNENEYFQNLPASLRESYDVVCGHFSFGIHRYVNKPCTYMTILREPVARTISDYFFRLSIFEEYKQISLLEFIAKPYTMLTDNGMTRWLSGVRDTVEYGGIKKEHLLQAKENLRCNFSAVGITEMFNESMALFKAIYQWRNIEHAPVNVTKPHKERHNISRHIQKKIEEFNCYDVELYNFGKTIFRNLILKP